MTVPLGAGMLIGAGAQPTKAQTVLSSRACGDLFEHAGRLLPDRWLYEAARHEADGRELLLVQLAQGA